MAPVADGIASDTVSVAVDSVRGEALEGASIELIRTLLNRPHPDLPSWVAVDREGVRAIADCIPSLPRSGIVMTRWLTAKKIPTRMA